MSSKRGNLVEQHVEKLALLVCVGLLGFVAYKYMIKLPVTVPVNGQQLGPEQVDPVVLEKAEQLKDNLSRKSRETTVTGQPIDLRVTPYADKFQNIFSSGLLNLKDFGLLQPRPLDTEWHLAKISIKEPTTDKGPGGGGEVPGQLAILPKILPPINMAAHVGHSYVIRQTAPAAPARGGAAAPAALGETEDTHWVTAYGTLDKTAQVQALLEARYPDLFRQCLYLHVYLERCEVLANGKETEPVTINPLPTVNLIPTPEFPAGEINALMPKVKEIMDPSLATSFISQILTPEYQTKVLQAPMFEFTGDGDPWNSPFGGARKNSLLPNSPQPVAPSVVPPAPPAPKGAPLPRAQGIPPMDPPLLATGPGGGHAAPQPPQPPQPPVRVQPTPVPVRPTPTPVPAKSTPTPRALPTPVPGAIPSEVPPAEVPPGDSGTITPAVGEGVPGTVQSAQPFVWAHDLTVIPGKTYRYRLRVSMYNRLAGLPIRLLNPADARVVELFSAWSDWTPPVSIPMTVEWYLTGGGGLGGSSATATVFKILPGDRPVKASFKIEPGQPIGQVADVTTIPGGAKQSQDFTTGALLLEVRKESMPQPFSKGNILEWNMMDTTVIVYQDATGAIHSRVLQQDKANSRYKELETKVKTMTSTPRSGS